MNNKAYTIWFTGLSGSGKTTIANGVVKKIRKKNIPIILLDGDVVRKTFSRDLGYTKEERDKHITRVADICHLITTNGVLNIACVLSPTKKIRSYARDLIKNFVEVYIKCPILICEERDVKGYYNLARSGVVKEFVGITIRYEDPVSPEIIVETDKDNVNNCVNKIIKYLEENKII